MSYNLSEEDYKSLILKNMQRLLEEKRMKINPIQTAQGTNYTIQFRPPEWYLELDEDLKSNILYNLQEYCKDKIIDLLKESNMQLKIEKKEKKEKTFPSESEKWYASTKSDLQSSKPWYKS